MLSVPPQVLQARQLLLEVYDFDLYADPIFIERLVCDLCNLEQTHKQGIHDALHPSGVKVEIKLSSLNDTGTGQRFVYSNLRGMAKKAVKADVYVLVGYMGKGLRFFVLSAHDLGHRTRLEIFVQPRRYVNTGKWLDYEVPLDELEKAIVVRGKAYREVEDLGFGRLLP